MPSDMMLVIAGGWHRSGWKAGDSNTSHRERRAGKDCASVQWMEEEEEGGKRGLWRIRGTGSAPPSLLPPPSFLPTLCFVTLEVGSVFPAISCWVILDPCEGHVPRTQDSQ